MSPRYSLPNILPESLHEHPRTIDGVLQALQGEIAEDGAEFLVFQRDSHRSGVGTDLLAGRVVFSGAVFAPEWRRE